MPRPRSLSRPRVWLLAVALALVGICTAAAAADAFIYLGGVGSRNNGKYVGRATTAGKKVNQQFINTRSAVKGLVTQGSYLYWVNGNGNIARAKTNGRGLNRNFIANAGATNLAVSSSYLYWVTNQSGVGRANLNGSSPNPSFIPGSSANTAGAGIAVDSSYIYWSVDTTSNWSNAGAAIARANLDGSSPNLSFMTGTIGVGSIAVNAGNIFWASSQAQPEDGLTCSIGSANINGSSPNPNFIGNATPKAAITQVGGLALSGSFIYWTDTGIEQGPGTIPSYTSGSVGRAKLNGTSATDSFIRRLNFNISSVAVS